MTEDYTQEQLWKIYEKLPQELKEAIFSEKTAESILDICVRNGIEDNQISEIARYTGQVLLGILPPNEFQETLEKELKLEKSISKKLVQEINQIIFSPVKDILAKFYKKELPIKEVEEKPKKSPGKDAYRELIE